MIGFVRNSAAPVKTYRYFLYPANVEHVSLRYRGNTQNNHLRAVTAGLRAIFLKYFRSNGPLEFYLTHDDLPFVGGITALRSKLLDDLWFYNALLQTEQIGGLTSDIGGAVCRMFVNDHFSAVLELKDSEFPALPVTSYWSLASVFHRMNAAGEHPWQWDQGLFAVLREARGDVVEEGQTALARSVARDLLWLSRSRHGIYYSAYDCRLYHVHINNHSGAGTPDRRLVIEGSTKVSGTEVDQHQLNLLCPLPLWGQSPRLLDAILSGTGRSTSDLAAWKVLIARPSWAFADRLNTILHLIEKESALEQARDIVKSCRAAFLFLRSGDPATATSPRQYFRSLLSASSEANTRSPLSATIRSGISIEVKRRIHLDEILAGNLKTLEHESSSEIDDRIVEIVIDSIEQVIDANWYLIEPVQIVSFINQHVNSREEKLREKYQESVDVLLDFGITRAATA